MLVTKDDHICATKNGRMVLNSVLAELAAD